MSDEIYILCSAEVGQLLLDNQVDIVDVLRQAGLAVEADWRANPATPPNSQTRELVTVLIGVSGLLASMTPMLKHLIDALSRKPILVSEQVLIPVEDADGNIVRTAAGEPVLHWVSRHRYVETHRPGRSRIELEVAPTGLRFEVEELSDD